MNSEKTRQGAVGHKTPVQVETDLRNNVQVLDSELNEIDELAIDEDFNVGGDPYNSTGQHVIIKPQKDSND